MVSDVNEVLSTIRNEQRDRTESDPLPQPQVRRESQPQSTAPARSVSTTPVTSFDFKMLAIVGGGVCLLLALLYALGDHLNPPSGPSSPSTARPSTPGNPSERSPAPNTSARPSEEMPPVGTNHVLSSAQIRYCVAENIRLAAAQQIIHDTDVVSDVLRFNDMIEDYNSRCSEYRYRRGALESAQGEVERYRPLIELEGVNRFQTPG